MFQDGIIGGLPVRLTLVRTTLVVGRDEWDHEFQRVAAVPLALECEFETAGELRLRVSVEAFRGVEEAFREAFRALAKCRGLIQPAPLPV